MNTNAWFILIYACPGPESQAALSTALRNLGPLIVETAQTDNEYFVIIETHGDTAAITVHELVTGIEQHAELVATHDGSKALDADEHIPAKSRRSSASGPTLEDVKGAG